MKNVWHIILFIVLINGTRQCPLFARRTLTLDEAVGVRALSCNEAHSAVLRYHSELLGYANYRKSLLPAFSFQFSPIRFNHSLRQLQDASRGDYSYVDDYANSSSGGVSVQQLVGWTGGTLSAGSNVSFLREFSRNRNSFSTNIFTLGYSQALWGGRRQFRMNHQLQRRIHELSLRKFCTEVSAVQRQVLSLYLEAFLYGQERQLATRSLAIEDTLLQVASVKRREGYLTAYDYNQVELQQLQSRFSLEEATRRYHTALRRLADYLGLADTLAVAEPAQSLPEAVHTEQFMEQVRRNNPTALTQALQLLQADMEWYTADLDTRFNGTVALNYGLNQYAERFADAYRHPTNSQSVSVSFRIPVFQWGINRNKRRIAQNKRQEIRMQVETAQRTFESSLYEQVHNYNSSVATVRIARRAYTLACEQYALLARKFALGQVSVYELTSARKEQQTALKQFYESLRQQYETYYALRHLALYDFAAQTDLAEKYESSILLISKNNSL